MARKISTDTFITNDPTSPTNPSPQRIPPTSNLNQFFNLEHLVPGTFTNTLVTPWASSQMIKDQFINIWQDPNRQNEKIAVEFDKKTLLLLLSQNGCEGLRFSFCKFNDDITLVANGIDATGKLIAEEMFKDGYKPNTSTPPPLGAEEGHGITLKDFKATIQKLFPQIDENFSFSDKFIDTYWSKSLQEFMSI